MSIPSVLSLYCEVDCRFDADDVAVAQALAGHLSVAMAAEKQIDQLGLALHNRTIIGQAQGVLMERYGMGADQAFDYLRRISSHSNRKVVAVAAEIAETRRIPDGGRAARGPARLSSASGPDLRAPVVEPGWPVLVVARSGALHASRDDASA